ncbi:ABC transporter substrate-binding protein [Cohnella fermenti]|uniref:Extracellular solute-binding protein n=1 Tax=Cohnella fermenti TaxID=2565925 RepID=A0A4S4BTZ5_9BACL|nr:extracellular solute-binding protein [Cohnella fermenti]THF77810.1 extracellular solute-binding protein [Cohnella fermenti]
MGRSIRGQSAARFDAARAAAMAGVWLVALGLGGCASGHNGTYVSDAGEVPLALTFIYKGGDSVRNQALQEVVDSFNEDQASVRIQASASEIGADTYEHYLLIKDAVGEFPDMLEMESTEAYADAGVIAPIPEEIASRLKSPAVIDGKIYAAPLYRELPPAILYNRDVFAKAGITELPNNWDDFLSLCERIREAGVSPIVVGGKEVWHLAYWTDYFFGANVYVDHPDWNSEKSGGTVRFADADTLAAVTDMQELWTRRYVNPGWLYTTNADAATELALGRAGMLYSDVRALDAIRQANPDADIGVFAPPDRQGRVVIRQSSQLEGIALSAEAARVPEKREAFSAFMSYFYEPEHYARYLQLVKGLASTKQEIDYDNDDETRAFIAIAEDSRAKHALQMNEYWGDGAMPDGFRDWYLGLLQYTLALNRPNAGQLMDQADEQWALRMSTP